ncbi:MAG: MMPL family transporter, partial [Fibrobacteraceae bacterium]|nr:MMPL family transporter [Fibrobacteraceae bacterium]
MVIISIACIYPVLNLRWELQLSDMLQEDSRYPKTENLNSGKLLPLSLVLESSDTLLLKQFAASLDEELQKQSFVRFCSYYVDMDFYKKNQMLFLSTKDLNFLYQGLLAVKDDIASQQNPFIVQLEEKKFINTDSLEQKYRNKFRNVFKNTSGTVRIFDVFPNINTDILDSARFFVSSIKKTVAQLKPENVQVSYTGHAEKVIQTGRALLPEAKKAGVVTAIFIAILLLIAFFRQPQLILPAGIPISLSIYWTLAVSYLLYGRICLFSLLLAIILPGLAAQHVTHIYTRYAEERRKGLNSALSLESAILGISPVSAVSAMTTAALFLSLSLVPFKGLQELGILGAICALFNWVLCSTITPALLRLSQKKKEFLLFGKISPEELQVKKNIPYKKIRIPLFILTAFTLLLISNGIFPKFHYNFAKTEFIS